MEDLTCPACRIPLTRMITERGVIWRCEKCDGRAVGLALLRTTFTPESINPIWLHALHHEGRVGRACPSCERLMIDVPLGTETPVNVEVCQLCQMVWFDANEIGSLQPRAILPAESPALSPEARQQIALAKVRAMAEAARRPDPDLPLQIEGWRAILEILAIPVWWH